MKPKCSNPACPSTTFELESFVPKHSNFELQAVICSYCGRIVAVIENRNINDHIDKIEEKLKIS